MHIYKTLVPPMVVIELDDTQFDALIGLVRLSAEYLREDEFSLDPTEGGILAALNEFYRKSKSETQGVPPVPDGQDNDGATPGL
jgi:hypothetical protein